MRSPTSAGHVLMALSDRNREPTARRFTKSPCGSLIAATEYALGGLLILLINLVDW
jgi:hypothetical protein